MMHGFLVGVVTALALLIWGGVGTRLFAKNVLGKVSPWGLSGLRATWLTFIHGPLIWMLCGWVLINIGIERINKALL